MANYSAFKVLLDDPAMRPGLGFPSYASAFAEVIEQNDRTGAVDLTGWTLADAAQHTYGFPAFTLVPGATVRVWSGTGTDDAENLHWGRRQAVWNNTGDIATLRDAAGNKVSRFAYTA
jgi:Lamin Tail Domain